MLFRSLTAKSITIFPGNSVGVQLLWWLLVVQIVHRWTTWLLEEVGCGNIQNQLFLVWLMWHSGKVVGILVVKFHALTWRDSATAWRATFATSEVIDEVGGLIHDGHTFFK